MRTEKHSQAWEVQQADRAVKRILVLLGLLILAISYSMFVA